MIRTVSKWVLWMPIAVALFLAFFMASVVVQVLINKARQAWAAADEVLTILDGGDPDLERLKRMAGR